MSDLQCPARVFVVGSVAARYAVPGGTSDTAAGLTAEGVDRARRLAERLRAERVAVVYTSRQAPAVDTGAVVARLLAVDAHVLAGVEELGTEVAARWPGGESGAEALARMGAALDAVADRHRGEAVLVVSHGAVMSLALPRLAGNAGILRGAPPRLDPGDVVALERDADGWRLTAPWPGHGGAQNSRARTSSAPRSAS